MEGRVGNMRELKQLLPLQAHAQRPALNSDGSWAAGMRGVTAARDPPAAVEALSALSDCNAGDLLRPRPSPGTSNTAPGCAGENKNTAGQHQSPLPSCRSRNTQPKHASLLRFWATQPEITSYQAPPAKLAVKLQALAPIPSSPPSPTPTPRQQDRHRIATTSTSTMHDNRKPPSHPLKTTLQTHPLTKPQARTPCSSRSP